MMHVAHEDNVCVYDKSDYLVVAINGEGEREVANNDQRNSRSFFSCLHCISLFVYLAFEMLCS